MSRDVPVTFSFGENWQGYLRAVDAEALAQSRDDITTWLGTDGVSGCSVVDVGSGSGIHSFTFCGLGASRIASFDSDLRSVAATRSFWEKAGRPAHWSIEQGSVLDAEFIQRLGTFDIIYAWGVLHHTGQMWTAIDHTTRLVAPGGRLWISIYHKGQHYPRDLALKQRYNRASIIGKRAMVWKEIARAMYRRARAWQNPFTWNRRTTRGMNAYHDLVDWLGGLPYEVASAEEVTAFCGGRNLVPERITPKWEGACSVYLFRRP